MPTLACKHIHTILPMEKHQCSRCKTYLGVHPCASQES